MFFRLPLTRRSQSGGPTASHPTEDCCRDERVETRYLAAAMQSISTRALSASPLAPKAARAGLGPGKYVA